jgi:hypothetical protein
MCTNTVTYHTYVAFCCGIWNGRKEKQQEGRKEKEVIDDRIDFLLATYTN